MKASHAWVDHTSELELELTAGSAAELFIEAAQALGELLADHEGAPEPAGAEPKRGGHDRVPTRLAITVDARDREALLAEWLSELSYHAETEGLVPERVEELELSERALEAIVSARPGSPPHLVKAVTYHRLAIWEEAASVRGRVVFDV